MCLQTRVRCGEKKPQVCIHFMGFVLLRSSAWSGQNFCSSSVGLGEKKKSNAGALWFFYCLLALKLITSPLRFELLLENHSENKYNLYKLLSLNIYIVQTPLGNVPYSLTHQSCAERGCLVSFGAVISPKSIYNSTSAKLTSSPCPQK